MCKFPENLILLDREGLLTLYTHSDYSGDFWTL